ncbi:MAG TPA: zinc ribbon domain-containing protein [Bryobacteraceae bacterium]|nr:zinc ribbon domain-containing protein [Bryobacteraceae bacterium]
MADFCTCGAQLPVDARFCHRCGKQLFADPPPEPETPQEFPNRDGIEHSSDGLRAIAAEAPGPEAPPPISFHNAHAVRAAFFTAIIVWLIMNIPLGGALFMFLKIVVLLGGGSMAVLFYSRRTGQILNVMAGARLGWITGVFFYTIWILFFTATLLLLQSQGGLAAFSLKQLQESNAPAETIKQFTEVMQSPETFGVFMVLLLGGAFITFTLLMILGGAAAAKVMERE